MGHFFPVHYSVTGVNIYVLPWHGGNHLSLVSKFFWPDPNMCETSLPDLTRSHRIALCISGSNPAVISPNALVPFCGIKHTQDVSDSYCSKEMCLGICTERYICPPFCLSSICLLVQLFLLSVFFILLYPFLIFVSNTIGPGTYYHYPDTASSRYQLFG